MKGLRAFTLLSCLVAAACGEDPARELKIVARPPEAARPAVSASTAPAPAADAEPRRPTDDIVRPSAPSAAQAPGGGSASRAAAWRHVGCPPPPESSAGPSSLAVAGPCAFEHRGAANCESLLDDFLLTMTRTGAAGSTLMVYVNVEKYHGPGSYTAAQMFVGLQDKKNIYRWSSDAVDIMVGEGEKFAVLPSTRLEAEPLLVNCTGPMNNYQCEGRGDADAFMRTITTVSGTLQCEEPAPEK